MRSLFPLVFQFVILLLDYTFDKIDTLSESELDKDAYHVISKKQDAILKKI